MRDIFELLIPLALDLFLWLGPRLSVSKVLGPLYTLLFEQARRELAAQVVDVEVDAAQRRSRFGRQLAAHPFGLQTVRPQHGVLPLTADVRDPLADLVAEDVSVEGVLPSVRPVASHAQHRA